MKDKMKKVQLLNTYVNNLSMDESINAVEKLIHKDEKSYVVAVNVDVIMKIESDSELKELTDKADIVLVDGKPLIWISKIHKRPIKAKISGSDLVPKLCELAAERGYTMYILGGADGIAAVSYTHQMCIRDRNFPRGNWYGSLRAMCLMLL